VLADCFVGALPQAQLRFAPKQITRMTCLQTTCLSPSAQSSEATYLLQHMYTHCNAHSVVIPEILLTRPLAIELQFMQLDLAGAANDRLLDSLPRSLSIGFQDCSTGQLASTHL